MKQETKDKLVVYACGGVLLYWVFLIAFMCLDLYDRKDIPAIKERHNSTLQQLLIRRSQDFHNMYKESEEIRSIYLEQGEQQWPKSLR